MKKMVNILRRREKGKIYIPWIIYGGITSIIIFLIFFILDICVINKDSPVITIADSLSYFGSIIGAILGLGGVILTIQYTQKATEAQRKEYNKEKKADNALSVCPLLQIHYNDTPIEGNNNLDLIEKSITDSDPQWENFTFCIRNMGRGVAQNIKIKALSVQNRENFLYISDYELQDTPIFVPYINVDEQMNFWITLNYNYHDKTERVLLTRLSFEYTDIFLNNYTELYDFHFHIKNLPESAPKKNSFTVPFNISFMGKELISKVVKDRNDEILDMGITFQNTKA